MPTYTPQQFGQMIKQKYPVYNDLPDEQITQKVLAKYPDYKDMIQSAPPAPAKPGMLDNLTAPLKGGVQNIKSAGNQIGQAFTGGLQQGREGAAQISRGNSPSDLIGGVGKVGAGFLASATSPLAPVLNSTLGKATNFVADKLSNVPAVQKFSQTKAGQITAKTAENVANYSAIAGAVGGAMEAPKVGTAIQETGSNLIERLNAPKEIAPLNANKVTDLYNRAIRPTVAGKNTAGQIAKANTNVISGLQAIAENKAALSFADANGEITAGAVPKSVDQLTQSIAQTKTSIFKQYDSLAKQAGEKGVSVEAPKIAAELQPVINSKSLAIANPKAVEYAKALQIRLVDAGAIDAQTAQDVIAHYNDSLKAFYKNPNYETASSAGIDALIANKFRQALDDGISKATGQQYQALKSQYGALSAMEKDVTHRNIVWGRQNNVGLAGSLANIASGAELVRALVTLNPADLAVSGAIKGIQKFIQHLNNPDVGVAKIFSEIERANPTSTGSKLAPTAPRTKAKP